MSIKIEILLLFLLISANQFTLAQTKSEEKNDIIEARIEYIGGDNESIDYSTLFDNLYYYYDHPVNLNNTKQIEVLLELSLLSEVQVVNLKKTHRDDWQINDDLRIAVGRNF